MNKSNSYKNAVAETDDEERKSDQPIVGLGFNQSQSEGAARADKRSNEAKHASTNLVDEKATQQTGDDDTQAKRDEVDTSSQRILAVRPLEEEDHAICKRQTS